MITDFKNKTAVLTGAGSGFGLECARIGAKLGMNLVLADVQHDALAKATAEMQAAGAQVLAVQLDVSKAVEEVLAVLQAEKEKKAKGLPSELMDTLIVYKWPEDIFPDFVQDPAQL